MAGEGVARPSGSTALHPWGEVGNYWGGGCSHHGAAFNNAEPPNSPVPDCNYTCANYELGQFPCAGYNSGPVSCTAPARTYARSYHVGGVHVLMADGAVRFVSENIDLGTWQAIATRGGEEVVGEFLITSSDQAICASSHSSPVRGPFSISHKSIGNQSC